MATRLYPTTRVPGAVIHGPFQATAAPFGFYGAPYGPVQYTFRAVDDKTDGGELTTRNLKTNQESNFDGITLRWMTDPLDAQSIAGTFDFCMQFSHSWLDGINPPANSSVVQVKFHVYITVGQTAAVRATLLSNYVDGTNFTFSGASVVTAQSFSAAQALSSQSAQDGDCIMIEMMIRVVSSPTPAPLYPPNAFTQILWRGVGTTDAANNTYVTDLTPGDTVTNRAPWFEFSQNLTFHAAPSPPANDACADAIDFTAGLPLFDSGFVDTTTSADTQRSIWYKFTAPTAGKFCITARGTNYGAQIDVWTGTCGSLFFVAGQRRSFNQSKHRSLATNMFDAVQGTEYFVQLSNRTSTDNAIRSGGAGRILAYYRNTTPVNGDLYVPSGDLISLRNGVEINFTSAFGPSSGMTGVGIDYTKRTMDDLNGGTHSGERILVGLHAFDLVEILDLPSLSYGDGQFEVDYINTPWNVPLIKQHPAQIFITSAGFMYVGWFGNGYLYVAGVGTLPAVLNAVSDNVNYGALKGIDATHGDNQSGAPYTAAYQFPTIDITAPWALHIKGDIMYYTSGSVYVPVGGDEVRRYNVATSTQGALFVNPALQGTNNKSLRGLRVLASGNVLLCNGNVVQKYNSSGALQATWTPSISEDAQNLMDLTLSPDEIYFYAIDLWSTRVFKVRVADMAEIESYQPYLVTGTLTQIITYNPPINALSGIYVLQPGKRNDTLYLTLSPVTTQDNKIPDPTYKTAKV